MFNAASKLYFTLAVAGIVLGFGYAVGTGDRVGFTNLVIAGVAAVVLAVGVFAFVPREALPATPLEPAEARPGDATDVARPSSWPLLGALSIGLLAAGAALGGSLVLLGVVVGLVATFAWFGQVWREHPSWTQAMTDRINDRFVVPIGLPGTIFLLAGVGVVSLSRLFLAVPVDVAPVIGIVVAFALLGAFYLLSVRSPGRSAVATLAAMAGFLVLASGVAGALKGEREFHHKAHGAGIEVVAKDLAFSTDEIDLPADEEVTINFINKEAVPHNIAIFDKKGGTPLFAGKILSTEGEIAYTFKAPPAGTYYFHCDVHPDQMEGQVIVAQPASAP